LFFLSRKVKQVYKGYWSGFQTEIFKVGDMIMCKKLKRLILSVFLCVCSGCAVNPMTGEEQLRAKKARPA
jgi:hypothetical protein